MVPPEMFEAGVHVGGSGRIDGARGAPWEDSIEKSARPTLRFARSSIDTAFMDFEPLKPEEVVSLWPTTVMRQMLSDAGDANKALAALAKAAPAGDLLDTEEPAAAWLMAQLRHGAVQYAEREGLQDAGGWHIEARLERAGFGQYQSLGNRPGALLCGRYGVTLPPRDESLRTRDDLNPGFLTFYDPRSAMNMNAIRNDPYLNYHRSIELKPGMLLIWPAYLNVFVHPNLSREPRVSVVFEVNK
jgi:hypothetical protein